MINPRQEIEYVMTPATTTTNRLGQQLKQLRMGLRLTTREVAALSQRVAADQMSDEFRLSHARLVQLENSRSAPSVPKLFTLSTIYGISLQDLLSAFIDLDAGDRLHRAMELRHTHPCSIRCSIRDAAAKKAAANPAGAGPRVPGPDTGLMSQPFEHNGHLSETMLTHLQHRQGRRFAFIGLSDYTMFPLIRPGSYVQIDDCQKTVRTTHYRTEYDRPIYFIELRTGYACSWCELSRGKLLSIPHPLSPCRTREFAFPSEAEIVGRVTGIAFTLAPAEPERVEPPIRAGLGAQCTEQRRISATAVAG
jgi:transcriptional regulator with XRE-family HTH domain